MCQKDADRIANSVGPDQTAIGAFCSDLLRIFTILLKSTFSWSGNDNNKQENTKHDETIYMTEIQMKIHVMKK